MGDKQDKFKTAPGCAFWKRREQEYHVDVGKKMINSILDTPGKGQLCGTKEHEGRQVEHAGMTLNLYQLRASPSPVVTTRTFPGRGS